MQHKSIMAKLVQNFRFIVYEAMNDACRGHESAMASIFIRPPTSKALYHNFGHHRAQPDRNTIATIPSENNLVVNLFIACVMF